MRVATTALAIASRRESRSLTFVQSPHTVRVEVGSSLVSFTAYVLYGEEFSNASWHHEGNDALDSNLIGGEQALCDELRNTLGMANSTDAGSVLVDTLNGATVKVEPACAD